MEPSRHDIRDVLWLLEIEKEDVLEIVDWELRHGPPEPRIQLVVRFVAALEKLYPDQKPLPDALTVAYRAGWLD